MPNLNMNNFQTRNRTFDPDPLPYINIEFKLLSFFLTGSFLIIITFLVRCKWFSECKSISE